MIFFACFFHLDAKSHKKKKAKDKEPDLEKVRDSAKKSKKSSKSKKYKEDSDQDSVPGSPVIGKSKSKRQSDTFHSSPRQITLRKSSGEKISSASLDREYDDYNNSNPNAGNEENYEDDFEDYSDDFEDDDEGRVLEIKAFDSNTLSESDENVLTPEPEVHESKKKKPKNRLLEEIVNAVNEVGVKEV